MVIAKTVRVLILGHPEAGESMIRGLDENAHVERVDNFESALRALRDRPFDVIISCAGDFVPCVQFHFAEQAAAILDNVSQGFCIVRADGGMDWANPRMLSLGEDVKARVSACCAETFGWARSEAGRNSHLRGRRFSITTEEQQHFEVTVTPVIDLHDHVTQVAAVVWDTTRARRLQEKMDAIDRAGNELVRLDPEQIAHLDARERLNLLEQKILRCIRELLHFDNFAIRLLDRRTNKLELVLHCGMPVEAQDVEMFATAEGNGIGGYVAATGRSYICADVPVDSRYLRGIPGARSSLTIPLRLNDEVVGIANFESTRPMAFNDDDRQFAEIFGRYVALALHVLELLVTERHATVGRVGSNMMAEITSPLNDILTEVESLVEDYIGMDDLRVRLRCISDNVLAIRESVKQVTSATGGLLGVRSARPVRRDPTLADRRILICDDEEMIRETVRDVLTGYGSIVDAVCDGEQAIALIEQNRYDLVLSDIKMPGKNGYEVFAAAKNANPDTPVMLMTGFGYDPNHSIVRARREGLSAVLLKPFKIDQLLGEIRMALKADVGTPSSS